jgi:hypothetical protein
MASTILGTEALTIPADNIANRPAGVTGALRYNTSNQVIEGYHSIVGTDNWYSVGGRTIIGRYTTNSAWNSYDIIWGDSTRQYQQYEIHWHFADPNTTGSRYYMQFFGQGNTIVSNSGSNGYAFAGNWGSSNDGADGGFQNYNPVNSNCGSSFPISNWYPGDSNYWAGANGESHVSGNVKIYQSMPTGFTNNLTHFRGQFGHYSVGGWNTNGMFGGHLHGGQPSGTSSGGVTIYPVRGIRIGILDGYTQRACTGTNAIITVYGLGGWESEYTS